MARVSSGVAGDLRRRSRWAAGPMNSARLGRAPGRAAPELRPSSTGAPARPLLDLDDLPVVDAEEQRALARAAGERDNARDARLGLQPDQALERGLARRVAARELH